MVKKETKKATAPKIVCPDKEGMDCLGCRSGHDCMAL